MIFALLGHYYHFHPWDVGRLNIQQVGMYLRGIPGLQLRAEYATAKLSWIVAAGLSSFGKNKYTGTLKDHLSPWAQDEGSMPNITREEAEGIRKALTLRLLTQDDLDHLEFLDLGHSEARKWGV